MGYRSEVAIVIAKNPKDSEGDPIKIPEIFEDNMFDDICVREDEGEAFPATLYHVEGIKWYVGDPIIDAIEKFLRSLDPEDYLFLCIGEDLHDVESRGSFYNNPFDVFIARHIEFNGRDA